MKPKQPVVLVLAGLGLLMTVAGISLQVSASRRDDLGGQFDGFIVTLLAMLPIVVACFIYFRRR
jgi:hypothetical protein